MIVLTLLTLAQATTNPSKAHGPVPAHGATLEVDTTEPIDLKGVVGIVLSIDATGKATACRVTQSSGSAAVDKWTCDLEMKAVRFEPATDAEGNPIAGEWPQKIDWGSLSKSPAEGPGDDGPGELATPEAMHLTQAQFDALHLQPGAHFHSAGPPTSDGLVAYRPPSYQAMPDPGAIAVRQGEVLAGATMALEEQAWRTDQPLALPAPFIQTLPAGTPFGGTVGKSGAAMPCLLREQGKAYSPLEDEKGQIYPGVCLVDADGDGRYDHARLIPYRKENPEREVPIVPITLRPYGSDAPDAFFYHGYTSVRTIVIEYVEPGQALLALREAVQDGNGHVVSNDILQERSIPLRDGAKAVLDAVSLTARSGRKGWTIAATGRIAPWLSVNGDQIIMGDRVMKVPLR